MSKLVIEELLDHVCVLTMNRPERHHALNRALSESLAEAMERAKNNNDVRVIVLTGSGGKAFCAGADMLEASGIEETKANAGARANTIAHFSDTPIPIIAAVNGYCYGGGARLAIACDIRLASETATFRLPGAEYGLVVAAATLPRLIGSSRAKELIFSARRFDAHQALEWGLVNSLHSPGSLMPAALELAKEIASNSVEAVRASKLVIDAATLSETAIEIENEANQALRGSPDQVKRFRSATRRVTGR